VLAGPGRGPKRVGAAGEAEASNEALARARVGRVLAPELIDRAHDEAGAATLLQGLGVVEVDPEIDALRQRLLDLQRLADRELLLTVELAAGS